MYIPKFKRNFFTICLRSILFHHFLFQCTFSDRPLSTLFIGRISLGYFLAFLFKFFSTCRMVLFDIVFMVPLKISKYLESLLSNSNTRCYIIQNNIVWIWYILLQKKVKILMPKNSDWYTQKNNLEDLMLLYCENKPWQTSFADYYGD